jgi:phage tail-like protein
VSTTLQRAYVAAHFALDLDGDGNMGFLRSVDGGGLTTDIQTYQQGGVVDLWRQVSRPKLGDISLQCGMGLATAFYDWIKAFFKRDIVRKSGAIIVADFNFKERTRRVFTDALISEVQFPALDGSSKEAALMTIKLVPEGMEFKTTPEGKGAKLEAPQSPTQPNKVWHAANFRFTIDGFEQQLKRVMKIEQFSIKQQILEYPVGHRRLPIRVPGRMEWPNLSIHLPQVDAQILIDQVKHRLVDYAKPKGGGMTGAIELLSPDKQTLCTISLTGVDIVSAEPQKIDASADSLATVKMQIQVEKMEVTFSASDRTVG